MSSGGYETMTNNKHVVQVPHATESVYKLNIDRLTTEKLYSIRKMAGTARMSEATIRRRIKRNDIYHCKINDRAFFLEWQLLAHKAINLKQEYLDLYMIKFDKGEHVTPAICDYFLCIKDATKTIEKILDDHGKIKIKKVVKDINELILENNSHKKPQPSMTHEYLVSPCCWAKFELATNNITFAEHGNLDNKFCYEISHERFKGIKDCLIKDKDGWTIKDLLGSLGKEGITK